MSIKVQAIKVAMPLLKKYGWKIVPHGKVVGHFIIRNAGGFVRGTFFKG
ncbi:hypothetical protein [Paracoccus sp. DMF]|nr:hypothetical protein [Paracoccus sp. DMF]MCV2448508.1 hypothetical protein [Paracoccus sp. DMF]